MKPRQSGSKAKLYISKSTGNKEISVDVSPSEVRKGKGLLIKRRIEVGGLKLDSRNPHEPRTQDDNLSEPFGT